MKMLVSKDMERNGCLDSDGLAMALLQYQNIADTDLGLSPAQILFSRMLRDGVLVKPGKYAPRRDWVFTVQARELALAKRHVTREEG